MKVLAGFEESGIIREAFKRMGHDAWSCDLLPTRIKGQHYQGDIRDVLSEHWDLAIFCPPCTRLTNSGVRWLHERDLWDELEEAAALFRVALYADIEKVAVENPIPHKYAVELMGRSYDQIIQPFMFGHPERKATCLWLKNLPKLEETNNVKEIMDNLPKNEAQRIHYMPPGPNRARNRSETYLGVGDAMAAQWG